MQTRRHSSTAGPIFDIIRRRTHSQLLRRTTDHFARRDAASSEGKFYVCSAKAMMR